jgi:2'-5' RNA ligase
MDAGSGRFDRATVAPTCSNAAMEEGMGMDDTAGAAGKATRGSGGGVSLRLFAALALPQDTAAEIAQVAAGIAERGEAAHAVDARSLHVTLAFLGTVPEDYVPAVAAALDSAAFAIPGPTACSLRGLGAFGRGGSVLGADVELELLTLLDSSRDAFVEAVSPYAPDVDRRPWHPHLALVRAARGSAVPVPTADEVRMLATPTWIAGDLRLYASLPMPGGGTTYRELHAVPLGEPALRD